MRQRHRVRPVLALSRLGLAATPAAAQLRSGAPSGDNQKAVVTQWIGPVEVTISYSGPDVHAPDGTDRRGKIWGELVPWGYATDAFGTCGRRCPWRAGANQSTVLRVSHDVEIGGTRLAAGSYGLFMLPGQQEWTLILSRDSTSWGHYTYTETEDALRVPMTPQTNPCHEWLTYEFTDRRPDRVTVALMWEDLALPFTIVVPDVNEIYATRIRQELRNRWPSPRAPCRSRSRARSARGYAAVGRHAEARAAARAALAQAPDDLNRDNLRRMIADLEQKN
jgi:hypothetical protein